MTWNISYLKDIWQPQNDDLKSIFGLERKVRLLPFLLSPWPTGLGVANCAAFIETWIEVEGNITSTVWIISTLEIDVKSVRMLFWCPDDLEPWAGLKTSRQSINKGFILKIIYVCYICFQFSQHKLQLLENETSLNYQIVCEYVHTFILEFVVWWFWSQV